MAILSHPNPSHPLGTPSRGVGDRPQHGRPQFPNVLDPLRRWLDGIAFTNPCHAHWICRVIPGKCPFERTLTLFGRTLCHIPPLCKLNPLYPEIVALRFRALAYLADECGEDVGRYVC